MEEVDLGEEVVLLLIVDGMSYSTLEASNTPMMDYLHRKGAMLTNCVVEAIPTISRSAHATIATGAPVEVHGIYGNKYYERKNGKLIGFGPKHLRAETIAEVAEREGLNVSVLGNKGLGLSDITQEMHTPGDEGGAKAIRILGKGASVIRVSDNTEVLEEARKQILEKIRKREPISHKQYVELDNVLAELVVETLDTEQPDLLMATFFGVDKASHGYGPTSREAIFTMENFDRILRRILLHLEEKRTKVSVIVTADHGNTEVNNYIDIVSLGREIDGVEEIITEGRRSARVYLEDDADREFVKDELLRIRGVRDVVDVYWDSEKVGDLMVFPGYSSTFGVGLITTRRSCHGSPAPSDSVVPLLYYVPGMKFEKYVIVRQVDISPTISSMIGVSPPKDSVGRSLFSPFR
ncbi:hypothetical protein DRN46_05760 [Thermococci archaeon]|nr:MAG: hypothetical protein DRN46_05760 [Thermococci archaeon]